MNPLSHIITHLHNKKINTQTPTQVLRTRRSSSGTRATVWTWTVSIVDLRSVPWFGIRTRRSFWVLTVSVTISSVFGSIRPWTRLPSWEDTPNVYFILRWDLVLILYVPLVQTRHWGFGTSLVVNLVLSRRRVARRWLRKRVDVLDVWLFVRTSSLRSWFVSLPVLSEDDVVSFFFFLSFFFSLFPQKITKI